MRLLVIEDNRNLVANLFAYFEARGHVLDAAPDGITGLHLALTQPYDALILDWMLPRMDGPEVLRKLRNEGQSDIPVIMLTARDELPDKLEGFRAGADDYLTKPFHIEELLARLRAVLRRVVGDEVLRVADLEINTATREVRRGEREIDLTAREFELLEFLARNARHVLSRELIIDRVWDNTLDLDTNVVDVYIGYLRKKIDLPGEPRLIQTIRGAGYALRED